MKIAKEMAKEYILKLLTENSIICDKSCPEDLDCHRCPFDSIELDTCKLDEYASALKALARADLILAEDLKSKIIAAIDLMNWNENILA